MQEAQHPPKESKLGETRLSGSNFSPYLWTPHPASSHSRHPASVFSLNVALLRIAPVGDSRFHRNHLLIGHPKEAEMI